MSFGLKSRRHAVPIAERHHLQRIVLKSLSIPSLCARHNQQAVGESGAGLLDGCFISFEVRANFCPGGVEGFKHHVEHIGIVVGAVDEAASFYDLFPRSAGQ